MNQYDQRAFELVKRLYKNDYGEPFEMTPGQIKIFRAIYERQHPRIQMETYTQYGKEIADDIPVLTSKGWKNHGELKVGDYVFNHLGEQVKVKAILGGTDENNIEITFSTGESIVCHPNHEWWVKFNKWANYQYLETKDIIKKKLKYKNSFHYNFKVPLIKPLQFPERNLPIPPYVLGVWLGDGISTKPAITISPKDEIIFSKFPYKITKRYRQKGDTVRYEFRFCDFKKHLHRLGLLIRESNSQRKGKGKKVIPDIYKYSSIKQRLELLAGLIDTDGTVNKQFRKEGWRNGRVYIVNTNQKLVDDIVEVIRSLGMRPCIVKTKATISSSGVKGKKDVYYIGFDSTLEIPTLLLRKKIIPRQKPLKHITIRKIKIVKPRRGKCINVEGGIYLVGRTLIPTHNSDVVAMAVLTRATTFPEKWPIIGGTAKKAKIIMSYVIKHIFENDYTKGKFQIGKDESLERIKRERSKERLTFKVGKDQIGEIFILSAEARRKGEDAGDILMGFGAPNLIEDDAALIPNRIHGKVMRMIGGHKDNFIAKIGNTFNRNHFLRTHEDPKYKKIIVDCYQGIQEGRITPEYIEEMKKEFKNDPVMFGILYECKFPPEEMIEEGGWMPLLTDQDIEEAQARKVESIGQKRLGGDIGEGENYNAFVIRTDNYAYIKEKNLEKDLMKTVDKIIKIREEERIFEDEIFLDAVGVGAGVVSRCHQLNLKVNAIKSGEKPTKKTKAEKQLDPIEFYNLRAEMFWNVRKWIKQGGALEPHKDWEQLTKIKYKEDAGKKIKIMSKEEMRRRGLESPDIADALALTFAPKIVKKIYQTEQSGGVEPYYPELGF